MIKVRQKDRIGIHGHRGSRGTHPENVIVSFEEAAKAGADFFELDVHLSSDDIPIVFHDPVISGRVCRNKDGEVVRQPIALRTLKATEIQQYECGDVRQTNFPNQKLLPGLRIPTLEEVLKWMESHPAIGVNIEIKMEALSSHQMPKPELFARKVVELIREYKILNRVIVQSFDFRPLIEAKKLEPKLTMSCLFEKEADYSAQALKTGAQIIGPNHQLLSEEIVTRAHDRGLEVMPWTVNDKGAWEKMIEFGVDGIITDYPHALKAYLGK